jgi:hypothetical protein
MLRSLLPLLLLYAIQLKSEHIPVPLQVNFKIASLLFSHFVMTVTGEVNVREMTKATTALLGSTPVFVLLVPVHLVLLLGSLFILSVRAAYVQIAQLDHIVKPESCVCVLLESSRVSLERLFQVFAGLSRLERSLQLLLPLRVMLVLQDCTRELECPRG